MTLLDHMCSKLALLHQHHCCKHQQPQFAASTTVWISVSIIKAPSKCTPPPPTFQVCSEGCAELVFFCGDGVWLPLGHHLIFVFCVVAAVSMEFLICAVTVML